MLLSAIAHSHSRVNTIRDDKDSAGSTCVLPSWVLIRALAYRAEGHRHNTL